MESSSRTDHRTKVLRIRHTIQSHEKLTLTRSFKSSISLISKLGKIRVLERASLEYDALVVLRTGDTVNLQAVGFENIQALLSGNLNDLARAIITLNMSRNIQIA